VHAAPHVYEPPQPSLAVCAQPLPAHAVACVSGEQHDPASHTCALAHSDGTHETVPPQPSLAVPPHWLPHATATVLGVQHAPLAHTWPAPQPHAMVPPHPSETLVPHGLPAHAAPAACGVQHELL
jgi:hypothetical protein